MQALQMVNLNEYIGDDVVRFLNEYKSLNTRISYNGSLNKLFKDLLGVNEFKYVTKEQIESISVRMLKDYFNELSQQVKEDDSPKYKNATINRHISVIKEFIRYLYSEDVIQYNVYKLESLKLLPDTREEIEMIPFELAMQYVEYFSKEDQGLEKSLIIKLAIETALRAEELINIRWSNFTLVDDGVILKSHGDKKGKGNKEWIDKIDKKLYEELVQLKEIGNTDKLFNLNYKNLDAMMIKGNKILNNDDKTYSFHSFKKLAVTMCYLNNGNCIDSAMKKARHSNVNTTMRYLRLTNLNVTGIMSAKLNTDNDLYKSVDHDSLIKALSEMRPEILLLLNNKIKNNLRGE